MDKRLVLMTKLLTEKTEVLLILLIATLFMALQTYVTWKSLIVFGNLTEHPENMALFKEYIVFTILLYIIETFTDLFASICKLFSNYFISDWIFNIMMKETLKDFQKTTPEAHLTYFETQRDGFSDFVVLILFKIPLKVVSSVFILFKVFSNQNAPEVRIFLIFLVSATYILLSHRAISHRRKMMVETTVSIAEKNSQCRTAMDNYETIIANRQQKRQRRLFLELLYMAAKKTTRYFLVSENYRLAMRLGITAIKLTFLALRIWNDKIAIGCLISMINNLSGILLSLRNDMFLLIEYKNLADIKDVKNDGIPVKWDEETSIKLLVGTGMEFTVYPGRPVLLVGPSSSGKTTALQAIVGAGDDNFKATIDGVDTSLVNRSSLCEGISYLAQQQYLFSGTIESNLLLGTNLSSETLQKKLDELGLKEYFDEFPKGIKTLVGEKACGLSNGQRQLICILRCVLREAQLYVFDEPGTFLDTYFEKMVYQMIFKLRHRRVVVASQSVKYLRMFDMAVRLS